MLIIELDPKMALLMVHNEQLRPWNDQYTFNEIDDVLKKIDDIVFTDFSAKFELDRVEMPFCMAVNQMNSHEIISSAQYMVIAVRFMILYH